MSSNSVNMFVESSLRTDCSVEKWLDFTDFTRGRRRGVVGGWRGRWREVSWHTGKEEKHQECELLWGLLTAFFLNCRLWELNLPSHRNYATCSSYIVATWSHPPSDLCPRRSWDRIVFLFFCLNVSARFIDQLCLAAESMTAGCSWVRWPWHVESRSWGDHLCWLPHLRRGWPRVPNSKTNIQAVIFIHRLHLYWLIELCSSSKSLNA